jgi:adenine-specific DNA-methyltransferase
MRYFGSKTSAIDKISEIVRNIKPNGSFCDPFGGIASVSSRFLSNGYEVWSGDILVFPHYFQIARLRSGQINFFNKLLTVLNLKNKSELESYINCIPPKNGWFVREYSDKRLFFTKDNAMRIQSTRRLIHKWNDEGLLSYDEHATLLASLVNSFDKIANTAGTYYAYLKKFNRKSNKKFVFKLIDASVIDSIGNCYLGQAIDLVKKQPFDILYLDPPYNNRSYPHYYHLPQTVSSCTTPKVFGMSGVPKTIKNDSGFNFKDIAKNKLVSLLNAANFKLLVFHYSDDGLISPDDVKFILSQYGDMQNHYIYSKCYTTKSVKRNVIHHLYCIQNA